MHYSTGHQHHGSPDLASPLRESNPDVVWDYYYSAAWEVLEIRKDNDTDAHTQYLYGLDYIDAPAHDRWPQQVHQRPSDRRT